MKHAPTYHVTIVLALLAIAAAVTPLPAAARVQTAVLDEQQTSYNGALSVRNSPVQTMRSGRDGVLTRIEVVLCATIAHSTIRVSVSPRGGSAHQTATTVVRFGASEEKCTWQTVTFQSPIHVSQGENLRLELSRVAGPAPLWGANTEAYDPYGQGTGTWLGHRVDDFAFRIWVKPTT